MSSIRDQKVQTQSLSMKSVQRQRKSLRKQNRDAFAASSANRNDVSRQADEKFVLIDCDAGADDAWAIFLSKAAQRNPSGPGFNIVGVTSVFGNTTVDYVANNVTRTLDTVNDAFTPIFRGAENPMISKFRYFSDPPYYGEDGFGDANLPSIPTRVQAEHAIDAIIRLAEEYRGRLTFMCLGPLTNLAMALKIRPDIKNSIKEVFILGGTINGQGNATITAEYNFLMDPEAAKVVLEELNPCPITILPWETLALFGSSTYEFRTKTLGELGTPEIALLNKIEATILELYQDSWLAADPIMAACIINSNVIKTQVQYYCTVELNGSLTRGMMVVDKGKVENKPPNAAVITEIDRDLYESMLLAAVGGTRRFTKPNRTYRKYKNTLKGPKPPKRCDNPLHKPDTQ